MSTLTRLARSAVAGRWSAPLDPLLRQVALRATSALGGLVGGSSSSKAAAGSCTAIAARVCTTALVGMTATRLPVALAWRAATSATGWVALALGRMMISAACDPSIAPRISAMDGCRWGSAHRVRTCRSASISAIPSP